MQLVLFIRIYVKFFYSVSSQETFLFIRQMADKEKGKIG